MNYRSYMESHPDWWCPFCHLNKTEIIKEYQHFVVIPTRAPYCEDHLLIIPKEHDILLHDMPLPRHQEMYHIVDDRAEKLHHYHEDVILLLRDGKVWWHTGKSQNHIHFHLLPDYDFWWESDSGSIDRKFFDEDEYMGLVDKIKNKYETGLG